MIEESLSKNERRYLAAILVLIFVFVGADLITDSQQGVSWPHLSTELTVALIAGFGFFLLMKDSFRKSHELVQSGERILQKEKEAELWKAESQKYIQGLSDSIDAQLVRWSLTPSEKEVALLILKGLSSKEIAEIRQTSEKTVRAQSVSIYSKSGLAGKSELAAFFLEDLF
ncbi:helix-turn-helix transcriptional regulator [Bdellovibrio svalbardensis]|uniref:LuxR C-terminal-related transcriptional regulator n=1 Tax=Bdellovibrio svalbardensis TaxID=2972972 RepID=A0ABT6DMP5_9BACT|nr:LuxR C-terminal-related transcriptional regulator [Bdellovibrio svalbardensis]MDG0818145.1 LuxR C-terminal-related transcriptional regulator [Bdellovibrio svalbardensis]